MTTPAKIAANRRNALASTGPKTLQGKRRASYNSTRHGLLSRSVLLATENRAELSAFVRSFRADLAPQGAFEEFLVDRIASAAWRIRRAMAAEVSLFREGLQASGDLREAINVVMRSAGGGDVGGSESKNQSDGLGSVFMKTGDGGVHFGKLSRYEASLDRALYRALHELQRLQAVRQGRPVLPPLAVDVEVAGPPLEPPDGGFDP
jgi:hypothetical protein